jgi:hypothetical protein
LLPVADQLHLGWLKRRSGGKTVLTALDYWIKLQTTIAIGIIFAKVRGSGALRWLRQLKISRFPLFVEV